jgi:hypothetical protein
MYIILPHDVDGISKLEEKLTVEELSKILVHLPKREVRVSLPKFKLEETTDLKTILKGVCIHGYKGPMFVTSSWGCVYMATRDECLYHPHGGVCTWLQGTNVCIILMGVCVHGYKGRMFVSSSWGCVYMATRDQCL